MLSIALFESEPIYKLKRTSYSYVKKDKPTLIRSLVRMVQKNNFSKFHYNLAGDIYSTLYYANLPNYVTNCNTRILMIASCIYPILG